MPPRSSTSAAATEKTTKKAKSSAGGRKPKKLTEFNKFMRSEMARLKEDEPDMSHQDRFKAATGNWKNSPLNPKKST